MKKAKKFDSSVKAEVLKAIAKGMTVAQAREKYGISNSLFYMWKNKKVEAPVEVKIEKTLDVPAEIIPTLVDLSRELELVRARAKEITARIISLL